MTFTDHTIYHLLRHLHVVRSQYDFSRLCGRSAGWFSSTICRGREASPASLAVLASRLDLLAQQSDNWLAGQRIKLVSQRVQQELARRAMLGAGCKENLAGPNGQKHTTRL